MENRLIYSKPASCFTESLVLGNGVLGAAVYADPKVDRISLNHDTLWSGHPGEYLREGAYEAYERARDLAYDGKLAEAQNVIEEGFTSDWSAAYLPLGNLYITSEAEGYTDYRRMLDLEHAVADACYISDGDRIKKEYFVSAPNGCLCVRITSDLPHNYRVYMDSQLKSRICYEDGTLVLDGECPSRVYPQDHLPKGEEQIQYRGGSITFTAALRATTDGNSYFDGGGIVIESSTSLTLIFTANTSFISARIAPTAEHREKTLLNVKSSSEKDYSSLLLRHTEDFSSYYNRTSFDLDSTPCELDTDERLNTGEGMNGLYELLFNYGKYLTISASREGTRAMNLQGIWNELLVPPWQSNYTTNINLEMNYWPTLALGLTEFTEPLITQIKEMRERGKACAEHYYHAKGFVAHHNSDIWAKTTPVGMNTRGSARYAFWNGASGWLCQHLYSQYVYTLDAGFLRDTAYPIMRDAAEFYLSVMIRDRDGRLILCPATSPENAFFFGDEKAAVSRTSAMSMQIIAELFDNIIEASAILGINDAFVKELESARCDLAIFDTGEDGRLLEWNLDYPEKEIHHRHVSHLYALFPSGMISTSANPELSLACRKVLDKRGDASTGWSLAWKTCLFAKLKDGERALKLLDMQLSPVSSAVTSYVGGGGTYPNMLCAHPPFQIDGNFGITAGIINMLMQCEGGVIRILPALPKKWSSGSVTGLLAEGGISVSIVWKDGNPTRITLKSKTDAIARVAIGAFADALTYDLRADTELIIT